MTLGLKTFIASKKQINRRAFLIQGVSYGTAMAALPLSTGAQDDRNMEKKIKTGVIGCGSVSRMYFPHLKACKHVDIVSACDIIPERARMAAEKFGIPNHYPNIESMLAGAPFELLVNLTDMQEHERLNRQALEEGKHIWSEKPIANSLEAGQELVSFARSRGIRLWGAPTVVHSPQFAFMAKALAEKKLGAIASAHGSYGHLGPNWAEFFYTKGGGSLPDLAVYNLTYLTGLLGPARSVTAMSSIITPAREIAGKGLITVTEEDNAFVLMDHGNGVISQTDSSFNYFSPHEHDYAEQRHHTITVTGRNGVMKLTGYDWCPHAVDMATSEEPVYKRYADTPHDYVWECGASLVAQCLATGIEPLFTPEHALHVVEIITAARLSQETGRRVPLSSTFSWPIQPAA